MQGDPARTKRTCAHECALCRGIPLTHISHKCLRLVQNVRCLSQDLCGFEEPFLSRRTFSKCAGMYTRNRKWQRTPTAHPKPKQYDDNRRTLFTYSAPFCFRSAVAGRWRMPIAEQRSCGWATRSEPIGAPIRYRSRHRRACRLHMLRVQTSFYGVEAGSLRSRSPMGVGS